MANKGGRVRIGTRLARLGDRLPVIRNIRRTRTRKSNVLRGLGIILFWVSLLSLIPIFSAMYYHEDFKPFIATFIVTFAISMALIITYGSSKTYHHTDGMLMVILLWLSLFIIGMIPYLVWGGCSFINALFESVSGFTTVGATIFDNVEALPYSLVFWRVMTQWIGGIVIVLLFMVILPMFVPGRRSLAKDDLQPLTNADGVQMKVIDVAKQFILVYVGLTAAFSIIIWVSGMRLDDAIHIALATISIGGFSFSNDSLASINDLQKILIALMMIISATNFYLHFRMIIKKEMKIYFEDTEFKAMIIWYAILTVAMFAILGERFVDGFFTLISMATTTGFVSDSNFATWGSAALVVLAVAMFVGGSSGSPAGGIKLSRFIIIIKSIAIDAYQVINPSVVQVPKLNGQSVDEKKIHNAYAVLALFVIVCTISTIVFTVWSPLNPQESVFTSISLVTATGTSVGPLAASYDCLPDLLKIYTCFVMVFARMEIISLLAIFMPKFWIEVGRNSRERFNDNGSMAIINKIKVYNDNRKGSK